MTEGNELQTCYQKSAKLSGFTRYLLNTAERCRLWERFSICARLRSVRWRSFCYFTISSSLACCITGQLTFLRL